MGVRVDRKGRDPYQLDMSIASKERIQLTPRTKSN